MRNVVIFLEESSDIERVGADLFPYLIDCEHLYVVMQLPKLKSNAMPLIGDLKEIRYRKAMAQIVNWYQKLDVKIKDFNPLIFQERISSKSLLDQMGSFDELLVFGMSNQEKNTQTLFEPLRKKVKLDFVFANDQVK